MNQEVVVKLRRLAVRLAAFAAFAVGGAVIGGTPAHAAVPCSYYSNQSAYYYALSANEYGLGYYYQSIGQVSASEDHFDLGSVYLTWSTSYAGLYHTCILEP
jgi:hypothetical protein